MMATPVFQSMDRKEGWVAHFMGRKDEWQCFKVDYIKSYIFI